MGMLLNRHKATREAPSPEPAKVVREAVRKDVLDNLRAQAARSDQLEAENEELKARIAELEEALATQGGEGTPGEPDFESLTKQQIADLAKERFGVEIDTKPNKPAVIEAFQALATQGGESGPPPDAQ